MRAITKGQEPHSLIKHRANAHSDYANYPDKDGLRAALVRDQRGLCCYCMMRIEPTDNGMKIEHWECQETYPTRQLDYRNLLGACLGGMGQPGDKQHCDTRKGKKTLQFNPADPAHNIEQRLHFELSGTISSSDPTFKKQLDEVLGLNVQALKNRRKAVVDGLATWLRNYRERHRRGPDVATLQRLRAQWVPSNGQLKPFVRVAVWWLDQRLARSAT